MTINEAYLVALKTTVISTYIPVMNPGLYDTFPESFPGLNWFISWNSVDGNFYI